MKNVFKGLAAAAAILGSAASFAAPLFELEAASGVAIQDGVIGYYGGSDARNNKYVANNYGIAEIAGFYGANLRSTADTKVKIEFVGAEAGYINDFTAAGETFHWDKKDLGASSVIGDSFITDLTAGTMLDFVYDVQVRTSGGLTGETRSVANGANQDGETAKVADFFVAELADGSWLLALDDGGWGVDDDNHDDLVIRISRVPEPATLVLFGLGLAGLGAARRRKA